jgi:regulator of cell morphogenesis and NO signaling
MEPQSRTVGEIAAGSEAAIRILEQYGIDYCCGGNRPFVEVCREKGLSVEDVTGEIASAAVAAQAQSENWSNAPLRELIRHIVSTHHEYLKLELPRVGQRLRKVVQVHGENDPAAFRELGAVYEDTWQELDMHMHKEEMMLFPAIERYAAAVDRGLPLPPAPFGSITNPIGVMGGGARKRRAGATTDSGTDPELSGSRVRLLEVHRNAGRTESARRRPTRSYSSREQHPVPTGNRPRESGPSTEELT